MEFSEIFTLYRVFTSHMVLQRERPIVFSGKAESVTRAQKLIRRAVSLLPENTSMLLWNKIRKKRNALPSLFLHPLPPAGQ